MNTKKNIIQMIKEKKIGCFGHDWQMGYARLPSFAFEWEPEGSPRKTWISDFRGSLSNRGLTINDSLNRVLYDIRVFF